MTAVATEEKITKKQKEKLAWEQIQAEELTVNEVKVGRYTIVTVVDKEGMKGHGVSRCSELDAFDSKRGFDIASGRARLSLLYKRLGKEQRNHAWYLG